MRSLIDIAERGRALLYKTKKIVCLSMLVSVALVLSVIDARIPLLPALPGIKIGLASIITIILLRFAGWKEAILVVLLRCLLAWFFHGSPVALVLSLCGAIISTLLMAVLFRGFPRYFSLKGISIAGAVAHNVGQIAAASVIMQTPYIVVYLPWLIVAGSIAGYCIGYCSERMCGIIDKTGLLNVVATN